MKLERIMNTYKRHGGKRNRREQVGKIRAACAFLEVDPHNLGKNQIKRFYEHLRASNRSIKTINNYYYAFASLYKELGRNSKPPRPTDTLGAGATPQKGEAVEKTVSRTAHHQNHE